MTSRNYPNEAGCCADCRHPLVATNDGRLRPHSCWVQWNGEPTPWPWLADRVAAERLRVTTEYLAAMARGQREGGVTLREVQVVPFACVGQPDAPVRLRYSRDDVLAIQAMWES